jgi:hypothetical protein
MKCFTEMDQDDGLKNGITVEMDYFNLIVVKESIEEIIGWEAKSALKGGKPHNFICIGCGKVFVGDRTALQHGAVWEKVVHNKFVNLTFIQDRRLKQVQVRDGHGWEDGSLRRGIKASEEVAIARKKRNGGDMRNG